MSSSSPYEPVLSSEPALTLLALSKAKQRTVLKLVFQLAGQPARLGDYISRDPQGREIQHRTMGGWVLSYWADDAVRELRVVEIVEL